MAYNLLTRNGHNMYDMSSMLQKAIRRCDFERAGYAAYELFGQFNGYLWRRLYQISAEDCYGVITKEIVALKIADEEFNKKRKGYEKDPIFVAKAITLLCMARKNRDGCYVACNFIINDRCMTDDEYEHLDIVEIEKLRMKDSEIPDWVFDVHTIRGKKNGKTDWQMTIEEEAALTPHQENFFDDASWEPRYEYKKRNNLVTEEDYQANVKFREGRVANPVPLLDDTDD